MTEREHPLINSLIAETILSYTKEDDLSNHRLVCKTWFEVTLKTWRSSKTLNIVQNNATITNGTRSRSSSSSSSSSSSLSRNCDHKKSEVIGVSLEELEKVISSGRDFLQLNSKPYSRYRLKHWVFGCPARRRIRGPACARISLPHMYLAMCQPNEVTCGVANFPGFWSKFGHLMKYLYLDECEFFWDAPPPLLVIVFMKTPNLEFLSLNNPQSKYLSGKPWTEMPYYDLTGGRYSVPDQENLTTFMLDGWIPLRMADLFNKFPNLKQSLIFN